MAVVTRATPVLPQPPPNLLQQHHNKCALLARDQRAFLGECVSLLHDGGAHTNTKDAIFRRPRV